MTDEPTESINLTISIESITNGYLVSSTGSGLSLRDPAYRSTIEEVKRDVAFLIEASHTHARVNRERREKQEREWDARHGFPTAIDRFMEDADPMSEGESSPLPPGEETIPEWVEPVEKKGDDDDEPI